MKRSLLKSFALAISALLCAAVAQAAVVTFSYSDPITESPTELVNVTGQLGKFDPTLGTLISAMLTIHDSGTSTISLAAKTVNQSSVEGRAISGIGVSWSSPVPELDLILVDDGSLDFSTGGNLAYKPGESRTFGPSTDSDMFSYNLGPLALASLTGTGNFWLVCSTQSALTVFGGGGNFDSGQVSTAGCGAKVVYTYRPHPKGEVSVASTSLLSLCALGLLGLQSSSRRRRATTAA